MIKSESQDHSIKIALIMKNFPKAFANKFKNVT